MSRVFVADEVRLAPQGRDQGPQPRPGPGTQRRAVRARNPAGRVAAAGQHRPAARGGRSRRPPLLHHAVRRGRVAARPAAAGAAPDRRGGRRSCATSPGRWPTPTRAASCTATSSPTTCCSPAAPRSSPTSASPRRSAPRAPPGSGATLTQLGTSLGTPAYMAPEQVAGDPDLDHRVDLYALGCMAFELLTGQQPFANRTPQKMLAAHLSEAAPSPATLRPDTPPALGRPGHPTDGARIPRDRPQSAPATCSATSTPRSPPARPTMAFSAPGMLQRGAALVRRGDGGGAALHQGGGHRDRAAGLGLPGRDRGDGARASRRCSSPRTCSASRGTPPRRRRRSLPAARWRRAGPSGTIATMAIKASPHLTWRRTRRGGIYAVGGFAVLVVGVHGDPGVRHRAVGIAARGRQARRQRPDRAGGLHHAAGGFLARADRGRGGAGGDVAVERGAPGAADRHRRCAAADEAVEGHAARRSRAGARGRAADRRQGGARRPPRPARHGLRGEPPAERRAGRGRARVVPGHRRRAAGPAQGGRRL